MKKMSVSTRVQCSRCGETFEIGTFYLQGQEQISMFVVLNAPKSTQDAITNALCQICHGFKPGPALKEILERLGTTLEGPIRLLDQLELRVVVAGIMSRRNMPDMTSVSVSPSWQHSMSDLTSVAPPRASRMDLTSVNEGPARHHSMVDLSPVATSRPRHVDPFAPSKPRLTRRDRAHARPIEQERGGRPAKSRKVERRFEYTAPATQIALNLLKSLERAYHKGNTDEYDRLHALAVQSLLEHPLTAEAVSKERDRRYKARKRARNQAKVKAKKLLAQARKDWTTQDVTDTIDKIMVLVQVMSDNDRILVDDERSREVKRNSALRDLKTNDAELERLTLAYHLCHRATPEGEMVERDTLRDNKDYGEEPIYLTSCSAIVEENGNVCRGNPGTRYMVACKRSRLPVPNPPIKTRTVAGSEPEALVKIVYNKGDQFGDNPYLVMPDSRHAFMKLGDGPGVPEGEKAPRHYLLEGSHARMERRRISFTTLVWHVFPSDQDGLESSAPLSGTFRRGYVPVHEQTVRREQIERIIMDFGNQLLICLMLDGTIRCIDARLVDEQTDEQTIELLAPQDEPTPRVVFARTWRDVATSDTASV